jgi:hypothetical protein
MILYFNCPKKDKTLNEKHHNIKKQQDNCYKKIYTGKPPLDGHLGDFFELPTFQRCPP